MPAATAKSLSPAPASPIERVLQAMHRDLLTETAGKVADYIPELGHADPALFGLCLVTADGQTYGAGDLDVPFTIQSMSKPFTYGAALQRHGAARVLEQVGLEPTGESFNAIVLDEVNNRPFNPMVNAGAIAVAELLMEADEAASEAAMLALFSGLAGRPLALDEAVYASERATGHRNRAIAWMMLNTGMLSAAPEAVLDLYFRQCSVLVTARDMAMMAATLANRGVNPATGQHVFGPEQVRDVLTVMSTCGMYNYAGQWAYDVGLPAKSGVSGGIIAVIPGEAGIAIYAPPLDSFGNSVRGIAACRALSRRFNLHTYADRSTAGDVVRRRYTACEVSSRRTRSAAQCRELAERGGQIAVIELQGGLYFGSAEFALRRLSEAAADARHLILDFRRVGHVDRAAIALLSQAMEDLVPRLDSVTCAALPVEGLLAPLRAAFEAAAPDARPGFSADVDAALEAAEEAVLADHLSLEDTARYAFAKIDLLKGLDAESYRLLETAVTVFHFAAGEQMLRQGDEARAFFVLVRGSASVSIATDGRRLRLGSIGPGQSVGEMALVEGGVRRADVHADEAVTAYGFSIEALHALAEQRPAMLITILSNLVASMAQRLAMANEEIRNLE